jgi:hypothetical protein
VVMVLLQPHSLLFSTKTELVKADYSMLMHAHVSVLFGICAVMRVVAHLCALWEEGSSDKTCMHDVHKHYLRHAPSK